MKSKFLAILLFVAFVFSLLSLAACDKATEKVYSSIQIDKSAVGKLTEGDSFDPTKLVVKLVTDGGESEVLNLADVIVTIDGSTYNGSPVVVHSPSCNVKIMYNQKNGTALTAETTLTVEQKADPKPDEPVRKKVKVIVMAGQSNMVGHSLVSDLDSEQLQKYEKGFENVLIYNSCNPFNSDASKRNFTEDFVPVSTGMGRIPDNSASAPKGYFGPELGLAEYLTQTYPDEVFYIIKDATGGTMLYERWYSPSSFEYLGKDSFEENNLYQHLLTRVDEGMELLKGKNLDPEIVSLLWMQGESDALKYTSDYETLWTNFMADLTKDWTSKGYVTEKGLSTIDGGITERWSNYEILNSVKELWAAEHSKGHYIDVIGQGLTRKPNDPAHLDSPSMIKLGRLFGEKLSLVIDDLENDEVVTPVTLEGTGTNTDPYIVGSYPQWLRLAYDAFNNPDAFSGKQIKLTADIGSAEMPVRAPLGISNDKAFSGKLDGDGHTVYVDLLNRQPGNDTNGGRAMGLIGYSGGATVENLTVDGKVTLTDPNFYAGGFVGLVTWANGSYTTLKNCVNLAMVNVTANSNAGGFVGRMLGNLSVSGCENRGAVKTTGNYAAGIVGYVHKSTSGEAPSLTIVDTVNKGDIEGQKGVGGIVGLFNNGASDGTHLLTNVSNEGNVTGAEQVGGIVGRVVEKGFDLTITYKEAGYVDNDGNDVVVGSDGNKKITSITKITE